MGLVSYSCSLYNGPAARVWAAIAHKREGDGGQRQISLRRLRELQQVVRVEQRLAEVG